MKKLLFALLTVSGFNAQAQITLEKEYTEDVDAFRLSNGDIKYVSREVRSTINIYNANHSLYRSFSIPAGFEQADGVGHLSDKLFNTDAALEMVLYLRNPVTGTYNGRIVDEKGTLLVDLGRCAFADVLNSAAGTKLIAYIDNGGSKVYSLPGTAVPLKNHDAATTGFGAPYPNPTVATVHLPYKVTGNEVATLEVTDLAGRVVKRYQVDAKFDQLQLQAGELHNGVYAYRVLTSAGVTIGRRFVVGR